MGWSGEDYLHARSSASKYQGAVDCYRDDMIQQLFRGLPTTLWNQYCDKFLHIVRLEWVLYNSKEPIPWLSLYYVYIDVFFKWWCK